MLRIALCSRKKVDIKMIARKTRKDAENRRNSKKNEKAFIPIFDVVDTAGYEGVKSYWINTVETFYNIPLNKSKFRLHKTRAL